MTWAAQLLHAILTAVTFDKAKEKQVLDGPDQGRHRDGCARAAVAVQVSAHLSAAAFLSQRSARCEHGHNVCANCSFQVQNNDDTRWQHANARLAVRMHSNIMPIGP